MSDNNGWSGKPGVPLNPAEPGFHWVEGCDGTATVVFWRGHGGDTHYENGDLKELDYWSGHPMWQAKEWRYLGPCLTPAEVEALKAEVPRLNTDGCARDQSTTQFWKTCQSPPRLITDNICLTPAEAEAAGLAAAHKEWLAELKHDTDPLMQAARQIEQGEAAVDMDCACPQRDAVLAKKAAGPLMRRLVQVLLSC
jgi:hypothetical protein